MPRLNPFVGEPRPGGGRLRRAASAAMAVAFAALVMLAAPAAQNAPKPGAETKAVAKKVSAPKASAAKKPLTLPGVDSSNYFPYTQLTKANVDQLEMAWFYPYGAPTFSPVFANGKLYALGRNQSSLIALDAATGQELWVHEGLNGLTSKGINYWQSADGKDRRLIFSISSFLQQID